MAGDKKTHLNAQEAREAAWAGQRQPWETAVRHHHRLTEMTPNDK
jgi:hypothetical protein